MNNNFDLIVIGSGPGGYVAAIRASQLGLKTAVIEKGKPGGVCLNIGCIPSKALIHQAEMFTSLEDMESVGVKVDRSSFDYSKVFKKSRKAADTLSKGISFLLNKNKIEFIEGEAKLTGPKEVSTTDGRKFTAKNIIIATGSSPVELPPFPFDEEKVLSSTGALMLEKLPEKMLILGGGAIGVEFSYIFNAFGVEIHLVEMMDRILPLEDEEVVDVLKRAFRKKKIKTYLGTKAVSMGKSGDKIIVTLEKKDGSQKTVEVDKILSGVGRRPNTKNLGLEEQGIKTDRRGFIETGDFYETTVPGIYAIGDVINTPMLAHVASKEGETAAEHIAGLTPEPRIDPMLIPGAVYCEPQVASFGYTEAKAVEEGIPYKKSTFPYRGAGKSVAIEKSEGMIKVLTNPETGEILGAHAVGAEATELIHEILLAKSSELLPTDIATMIHAHPTLSETVMEAMRMVEGWAIHV